MKKRKGIILAGGSGTRLLPLTSSLSKQILPVFDKPMIYYPLATLMQSMIKDILIITTEKDQSLFTNLLNDGSHLGINITYEIQDEPRGISEAFIIGKDFIDNDYVTLILGDNIFYGGNLEDEIKISSSRSNVASIFGCEVKDPERYGVINFDGNKILNIEEKPINPKSNMAVSGLYFYDDNVCEYVKDLKPSSRGELEITDLNKIYLRSSKLELRKLKQVSWFDAGTHSSLIEVSQNIASYQKRKGRKIGCIEQIAFDNNFINEEDLYKLSSKYNNEYGDYLREILD